MYSQKKTLDVDRRHIWHPYTQMKDYAQRDHLVIVRGKGCKLYAADGKTYYDTISSWWCNLHGHSHPALDRALRRQVGRLDHVHFAGITHPYAAEVVDRLQGLLHADLSRFFFSDNGATSVEIALKMAFQYWQNKGMKNKTRFVFLEHSYHGDTAGAMSVGGVELYHQLYEPLRFASFQAASPNCKACPHRQTPFTLDATETGCDLQCFASMEKLVRREKNRVAAIIVEPRMQGAGGISFYPPAYLKKLRQLADEAGVLLIFDEVATGFGRTGTLFAYEQAGVTPDLICLSKGLAAGYLPLALTVAREEIFQAFYSDDAAQKTFFHGHTYTANPLACAVAAENLRLIREQNLPYSRQAEMDFFHKRLQNFADLDCIGDIRYSGFIGAVDLVRSRKHKKPFPAKTRMGFQVYLQSLQNGLILRPLDDTIYWYLPLTISRKDIGIILEKSRKSIAAAVAAA